LPPVSSASSAAKKAPTAGRPPAGGTGTKTAPTSSKGYDYLE
jgi:hypothetical protein